MSELQSDKAALKLCFTSAADTATFSKWQSDNPAEASIERSLQMEHYFADSIAECGTAEMFLTDLAHRSEPLREAQLARVCALLDQTQDPRLRVETLGAFSAYVQNCVRANRPIGEGDNGRTLTDAIVRVCEFSATGPAPIIIPSLLSPLFEIAHDRALSGTFDISVVLLCNSLMRLSNEAEPPKKLSINWEHALETLRLMAHSKDRYIAPHSPQVSEIAVKTLLKLAANNSASFPAEVRSDFVKLLEENAARDHEGTLRALIGDGVRHHLTQFLSETTPYVPYRNELGCEVAELSYTDIKKHSSASGRKEAIFAALAPCYVPTEQDVAELVEAAVLGDKKAAPRAISKLAALYLYADSDQEGLSAVKSAALGALTSIATSSFESNHAALAKVYLFNLYEKYGKRQELAEALHAAFDPARAIRDEHSAQSSLLAVRHLLIERSTPFLETVVENIASNAPTQTVRREGVATLCALYRRSRGTRVAEILTDLQSNPELAADREKISRVLHAPKAEQLMEAFKEKVLVPFGMALHEVPDQGKDKPSKKTNEQQREEKDCIDPQSAIYYSLKSVQRERALRRPMTGFAAEFGASCGLEVTIHIHRIRKPQEFIKALQDFRENLRAFEEESGHRIKFINKDSFAAAERSDPFHHLDELPVHLTVCPSLDEMVNWPSGKSLDGLESARVVIEPSSSYELRLSHRHFLMNLQARNGIGKQFDYLDEVRNTLLGSEDLTALAPRIDAHNEEVSRYHSLGRHSRLTLAQAHLLRSLDRATREELFYVLSDEHYRSEYREFNPERDRLEYVQELDTILKNLFRNATRLTNALTRFESYEVAQTELKRSLELLLMYRRRGADPEFYLRKDFVEKPFKALFCSLPKNEPLFSLINEVVMPSMLHQRTVVRVPDCFKRQNVFGDITKAIGFARCVTKTNPTSKQVCEAVEFFGENDLKSKKSDSSQPERKPKETESKDEEKDKEKDKELTPKEILEKMKVPLSELSTVIYAGTRRAAQEFVQHLIDPETGKAPRVVGAGAGHNALVITKSANLEEAADQALDAVVKNCGQDCASPCSILIEGDAQREERFLNILVEKIKLVSVGPYASGSRVGPHNSCDEKAWTAIRKFLGDHRRYLYPPGGQHAEIIVEGEQLVNPTILSVPLAEGASFEKKYSPLLVVQRYADQRELMQSFFCDKSKKYLENAMYISIYYRDEADHDELATALCNLRFKEKDGRFDFSTDDDALPLHTPESILRNANLARIDRGDLEFGGRGPGTTYVIERGVGAAWPYYVLDAVRFGQKMHFNRSGKN